MVSQIPKAYYILHSEFSVLCSRCPSDEGLMIGASARECVASPALTSPPIHANNQIKSTSSQEKQHKTNKNHLVLISAEKGPVFTWNAVNFRGT